MLPSATGGGWFNDPIFDFVGEVKVGDAVENVVGKFAGVGTGFNPYPFLVVGVIMGIGRWVLPGKGAGPVD